ncbi:MAG: hypothetical protein ACPGWR_03275 [Ardenticatenaceae bacterium]
MTAKPLGAIPSLIKVRNEKSIGIPGYLHKASPDEVRIPIARF